MPAPRNDKKANAMHALYLQGYSLSEVAVAFSVTRQCVYKMFAKRGFAMRTVVPLPFIEWNGHRYTPRKDGYYRRTTSGREYLHKDVWEFHNGPIPAGHDVHHKDENKQNNSIGNLELLTASMHGKLHSKTNQGFIKAQFKPGQPGVHYPRQTR